MAWAIWNLSHEAKSAMTDTGKVIHDSIKADQNNGQQVTGSCGKLSLLHSREPPSRKPRSSQCCVRADRAAADGSDECIGSLADTERNSLLRVRSERLFVLGLAVAGLLAPVSSTFGQRQAPDGGKARGAQGHHTPTCAPGSRNRLPM